MKFMTKPMVSGNDTILKVPFSIACMLTPGKAYVIELRESKHEVDNSI